MMRTGEVTRYLGTYGSARVAKGVLVSPIPPFLLQTDNNPEGLPVGLFDGFVQAATADTPAWMKGFLDNFYNIDQFGGTLVSDQAFQSSWNIAAAASATAAVACITTWQTDFRDDLPGLSIRRPDVGRRMALRQLAGVARGPGRCRPESPAGRPGSWRPARAW